MRKKRVRVLLGLCVALLATSLGGAFLDAGGRSLGSKADFEEPVEATRDSGESGGAAAASSGASAEDGSGHQRATRMSGARDSAVGWSSSGSGHRADDGEGPTEELDFAAARPDPAAVTLGGVSVATTGTSEGETEAEATTGAETGAASVVGATAGASVLRIGNIAFVNDAADTGAGQGGSASVGGGSPGHSVHNAGQGGGGETSGSAGGTGGSGNAGDDAGGQGSGPGAQPTEHQPNHGIFNPDALPAPSDDPKEKVPLRVHEVPEPGTLFLLAVAMTALLGWRGIRVRVAWQLASRAYRPRKLR